MKRIWQLQKDKCNMNNVYDKCKRTNAIWTMYMTNAKRRMQYEQCIWQMQKDKCNKTIATTHMGYGKYKLIIDMWQMHYDICNMTNTNDINVLRQMQQNKSKKTYAMGQIR